MYVYVLFIDAVPCFNMIYWFSLFFAEDEDNEEEEEVQDQRSRSNGTSSSSGGGASAATSTSKILPPPDDENTADEEDIEFNPRGTTGGVSSRGRGGDRRSSVNKSGKGGRDSISSVISVDSSADSTLQLDDSLSFEGNIYII